MITNAIILSALGSVLMILLLIIGWFIKSWMKQTMTVVEKTNVALSDLTTALNKVINKLDVYQATMDINLEHVKEKVDTQAKTIKDHVMDRINVTNKLECDLQDHEIRITLLEQDVKISRLSFDNLRYPSFRHRIPNEPKTSCSEQKE